MIQTALATLLAITLAHAQGQTSPAPRRVYVLHSGVHIFFSHPDKNYAAKVLRRELIRRGVSASDIVVLDCPFPQATLKAMVPREGLVMFLDSMSPTSRIAQDTYRHMDQALVASGVGAKDELIWIGHSAGGHMGMTMAHLSAELAKFADLAKSTRSYRFHTIVTLGTPVGCDLTPDNVRLRQYFSPQDKIVRIACDGGPWILPQMGYSCTLRPCTPTPRNNTVQRCWYSVEHPDWIDEPRVLDRVMEDIAGTGSSWWREPRGVESPGVALGQLLGRMLDVEFRIAVEELP